MYSTWVHSRWGRGAHHHDCILVVGNNARSPLRLRFHSAGVCIVQRAAISEHTTQSTWHRAESTGQRAQGIEQRAQVREQRAESKQQRLLDYDGVYARSGFWFGGHYHSMDRSHWSRRTTVSSALDRSLYSRDRPRVFVHHMGSRRAGVGLPLYHTVQKATLRK